MTGKILGFDVEKQSGVISGDDGNRYQFDISEWKSDQTPKVSKKVDFESDNKTAKEIYLDSTSSINTDGIQNAFNNIKNSGMLDSVQNNVSSSLNKGIQNKFGFIVAILTALAMFLPIVKIPFTGNVNALDANGGILGFILLLMLATFYYIGTKQLFVKVLTAIIVVFAFFQFYDLFTGLSSTNDMIGMFSGRRQRNGNFFQLLQFGTFILIPLVVLLAYVGFKRAYTETK